jgi:hypothetical protein
LSKFWLSRYLSNALFVNGRKSVDPDEGDLVTYEDFITPEGPEEIMILSDTVFCIR